MRASEPWDPLGTYFIVDIVDDLFVGERAMSDVCKANGHRWIGTSCADCGAEFEPPKEASVEPEAKYTSHPKARELAESIVRSMTEGEPSAETEYAVNLLGEIGLEHLVCVGASDLVEAIERGLDDAFFDGVLATPAEGEGEPMAPKGDSIDVISALVAMAEKSGGDDERWLLYAVKRLRFHADSGGQRDLAPMQGSSSLGVPPALASQPAATENGPHCDACGESHWYNFYVPDDVWEQIAPLDDVPGGGGVLCVRCIDKRCAELGLKTTGRFSFVGEAVATEEPVAMMETIESVIAEWWSSEEPLENHVLAERIANAIAAPAGPEGVDTPKLYVSRCGYCGETEGTGDPNDKDGQHREVCSASTEDEMHPHRFGVFEAFTGPEGVESEEKNDG